MTAIAYFNTNTSKHTDAVSLSYDIENRGLAVREGKQERPSKGVKMAIFQKKLVSKQPIGNISVIGDQTLKHGKLIDLNLNCTGSAPWLFCWVIKVIRSGTLQLNLIISYNDYCRRKVIT